MILHLVRLSAGEPVCQRALSLLPDDRRRQLAARRCADDRKRSLLGELVVRWEAGKALQVDPADVPIRYGRHGKPYVSGAPAFHFNISHAGNCVVVAVSHRPVGIDIERVMPVDLAIAVRCFTVQEYQWICSHPETDRLQAFFVVWTLKESYIKAVGRGLSIPLNSFAFDLDQPVRLSAGPCQQAYRFETGCVEEGSDAYRLALCHQEDTLPTITAAWHEQGLYESMGLVTEDAGGQMDDED